MNIDEKDAWIDGFLHGWREALEYAEDPIVQALKHPPDADMVGSIHIDVCHTPIMRGDIMHEVAINGQKGKHCCEKCRIKVQNKGKKIK